MPKQKYRKAFLGLLVVVEVEDVPVQILYGELSQSPRLFFKRLYDVGI